jgi:hypothetical protein
LIAAALMVSSDKEQLHLFIFGSGLSDHQAMCCHPKLRRHFGAAIIEYLALRSFIAVPSCECSGLT